MEITNTKLKRKSEFITGTVYFLIRNLIYFYFPLLLWIKLWGYFNIKTALIFFALFFLSVFLYLLKIRGKKLKKSEILILIPAGITFGIYISNLIQNYYLGTLKLYVDALNGYIPMANMGFSTEFFFFGEKPFVTSLIFKIFDNYMKNINIFFIAGYIIASFAIIFSLSSYFKRLHEKMLLYYLLILFFMNQSLMTVWLTIAQSEAPAIIFTLLLLSLCFYFFSIREKLMEIMPGFFSLLIIVFVLILFVFTRDTNVFFIPVLIPLFFFIYKKKWMFALILVFAVSIFVFHQMTFKQSGRWKFPLTNVLCKRIIPNRSLRSLFQEKYRFPDDSIVKYAAGKNASKRFKYKEKIYLKGRDDNWVSRYGLGAYKKFLLTHPFYIVSNWIDDWHYYNSGFYWLGGEKKGKKKLKNFIHDFPGKISIAAGFILLLSGIIAVKKYPPLLILIVHAFLIGIVSLFGDAMGVPRHYQQAAMTLRLSLLLAITILLAAAGDLAERIKLRSFDIKESAKQ